MVQSFKSTLRFKTCQCYFTSGWFCYFNTNFFFMRYHEFQNRKKENRITHVYRQNKQCTFVGTQVDDINSMCINIVVFLQGTLNEI